MQPSIYSNCVKVFPAVSAHEPPCAGLQAAEGAQRQWRNWGNGLRRGFAAQAGPAPAGPATGPSRRGVCEQSLMPQFVPVARICQQALRAIRNLARHGTVLLKGKQRLTYGMLPSIRYAVGPYVRGTYVLRSQ